MAAAFLLHDGKKETKRLYLKNPLDHTNLSINNLYYKKKRRIERNVIIETKEIDLDDDLISELKTLYLATQIKGIPGVSNNLNVFVRDLIKESINNYVSQKGLRKILFQLNSQS
jgi:Holliday junction resolvasome RuvABC ATP-dependent DNA helicase subunit